jgi:hypothetical protein
MPLILFCCILACISASVLFCSWRNQRKWSRRVVHLETYKGEVKAEANDELPSSTSANAWRSPGTLLSMSSGSAHNAMWWLAPTRPCSAPIDMSGTAVCHVLAHAY